MRTSVKWVKGCKTDAERKEVVAKIQAALPALSLLEKIIEEEIAIARRNRVKKDLYDSPNWSCFQADSIGEERAYTAILKLISIKEENDK